MEAAAGLRDVARAFEEQIGTRLFPLGAIEMETVIWTGSDGRFYIGLMYGLYILGETLRDATNQLVYPADDLKFCAETPVD